MCRSEYCAGKSRTRSMCFLAMHSSAQSDCISMNSWLCVCAGSEQVIGVDEWYGLSPVTERAVLRHDKCLVLLFTQQREHMLHQLTKPAITVERERERRSRRQKTGQGENRTKFKNEIWSLFLADWQSSKNNS